MSFDQELINMHFT